MVMNYLIVWSGGNSLPPSLWPEDTRPAAERLAEKWFADASSGERVDVVDVSNPIPVIVYSLEHE
jgi:hypothetical protein